MKKIDRHQAQFGLIILLLAGVAALVHFQAQATLNNFSNDPKTPPPRHDIAPKSDPVLAVAGDIACEPGRKPTATTCQDDATAKLIEQMNPSAVLVSGDIQYPAGSLEHFQSADGFNGTWGRFKSLIRPVPGNHEYMTPNAKGYYDYFGEQAGEAGKGYYSFELGSWHIIALNSEIDVSESSAQRKWLKDDLEKNRGAYCTLAYWHKPRFSSGYHADDETFDGLWRDLYDNGADVIINGHSHNYERFEAQNPDRQLDGLRGIVEFTVGTGGRDLQPLTGRKPHSVVIQNTNFGILKLTLHPRSYSFTFESIPGSIAFADSGELACHA